MNTQLAKSIIEKMVHSGVKTFCICPGGRSAPFLEVLSQSKELEVLSFYDERSCAFFALGRVKRDERPVAIVTTSGTAVAEILPAVIESYYNGLPLVLITADRPVAQRKEGSPQTIKNPTSLFKDYISFSFDISKLEDVSLKDWKPHKGGLHLNVSFDEPLIDQIDSLEVLSASENWTSSIYSKESKLLDKNQIHKFFSTCKKPILLVGELRKEEISQVEKFLRFYQGDFYLESLSQIQHLEQRLYCGDAILSHGLKSKWIDGVVRLGAIPRSRFWRDLEKTKTPVLNLSSPPFYSGLSRETLNGSLLDHLELLKDCLSSLKRSEDLKRHDRQQSLKWKQILEKYPESEEAWIARLKCSLPDHSNVFLGNSLPIRLWDKVSFLSHQSFSVTGQNGVNGIDGLLSRFFGECEEQNKNYAFIGDLSTLYDTSAFWISQNVPPWTCFVINNFGGQIFSKMFQNKIFINEHQISFKPLAELWGRNYECLNKPSDFSGKNEDYTLVEVRPDLKSTELVFQEYVSLWDTSV